MNNALTAFAALSSTARLEAFRLLIRAGDAGLMSGEIAGQLDAKQNSTSTNLSILQSAGLVQSTREGRSVRYRVKLDGVRGLLEFLMEECCGGNPDICRPALDEVLRCD